ncbi:MAG: DUF2804 domain-containing protein [Clostridiales bacterium]|nr:DUF2804 domain-containing protein [Clostridiales bacterium]
MTDEAPRTYKSWLKGEVKSIQREYTQPVPLLADDGTLLAAGWARHMLFDYESKNVRPHSRFKEWEFYQVSNGRFTVQVNLAKIAVGGFVSAVLIDLKNPNTKNTPGAGVIVNSTAFFIGSKKYVMPVKGDVPNNIKYSVNGIGKADFEFDTQKNRRTLYFKSEAKGKPVECSFEMDIPDELENITTVLPFEGKKSSFFMTMKQNCMPCSGSLRWGEEVYSFSKNDSFCCLDWGRVNAPHRLVWYWGNGSTRLTDSEGRQHIFGFEITWGIGDESFATETCLFLDGKVHKLGAVDVEVFPKPDKYMQPWHFLSEDGRFNMTMSPFYDQHSDMNALVLRMHCHQLHGLWNGTVVLDDGATLEIKDMYAFCEYVENRW